MPDLLRALRRDGSGLTYGLEDLAADAIGLLDSLGVSKAHLVGVSMGGMVAQVIAVDFPDRVASLCSALSSTGDRRVGQSSNIALQVLLRPAARTRSAALEQAVEAARVTRALSSEQDLAVELERSAEAYDRGHNPAGSARQLAAILAAADRTERLSSVTCPTVVIHGTEDPLIDCSGGQATAAAIPDSSVLFCEGMGHDLGRRYHAEIIAAIVHNIDAASPRGHESAHRDRIGRRENS
jgi:pimeloyl-ACP methyl ester carboxylesterase